MKKKTMRVSVILLALMLMLSMSACSGGGDKEGDSGDSGSKPAKTALELYNAATKSLNDADSYSATTDITVKAEAEGQSMEMKLAGDLIQVNKGEGQVEIKSAMQTTNAGAETDISVYYKDGYYYAESMGQKMKRKMEMDEAVQQTTSKVSGLTEDMVKEQSVGKTEEGQEIKMTLDGQKVMDKGITAFGGMTDQLKSGTGGVVTMGDMTMTAILDDSGNLKSLAMTIPMTMTASEREGTVDATSTMEITKIGGLTIEFPKDLDSYKESAI